MRKTFLILSLILVVVAVPAIVLGCGSKNSTTIPTPQGNVNIQGGDQAPTEAQLGVAIYPGATYVAGSGGSYAQSDGTSAASGNWTTSDSFDKVVSFYTGKIGAPISSDEQGGRVAVWILSSDTAITTVTATENSPSNGKVSIEIGMLQGSGLTGVPGP